MEDDAYTENGRHGTDCFGLTIRTPAGFASAFAAQDHTMESDLVKRSVAHFVARDQLERGEFRLALIRDGEPPIPLESNKPLGVYGLIEGDTLHLVSCKPHVDG